MQLQQHFLKYAIAFSRRNSKFLSKENYQSLYRKFLLLYKQRKKKFVKILCKTFIHKLGYLFHHSTCHTASTFATLYVLFHYKKHFSPRTSTFYNSHYNKANERPPNYTHSPSKITLYLSRQPFSLRNTSGPNFIQNAMRHITSLPREQTKKKERKDELEQGIETAHTHIQRERATYMYIRTAALGAA